MLSAKDFELLLPWYLNGTLTNREHALVAAYLKAHPEEDARVQWHASLRTCIKEQADELPEDLGRDRVLAAVRRDITRAPKSQRTRDERHMAASVAAWADTLRRLRDTLGRWGTVPRVAALTCMTLVVGAVVVTMMPQMRLAPVAMSPAPGPKTGSQTAVETSKPNKVAADYSRITDNLCSSKTNPDQPPRTPTAWLKYIKVLRALGCPEAADKELVEFRKKYPNEKVPTEFTGPK